MEDTSEKISNNQSKTTEKLDKGQLKRFKRVLQGLPDKKLLDFVETQDQIERFLTANGINHCVAECFESRSNMRNDPISDMKGTPSSELIYDLIWVQVDSYLALWSMTQMCFDEIKKIHEMENIDLPFPTAWDLFIGMVSIQENTIFARCLEKSCNSINPRRDNEISRLVRSSIWLERGNLNLSDTEKDKLNNFTIDYPVNPWLKTVYSLAKELSKSNLTIERHYKVFQNLIISAMDLNRKVFSDSSKGKLKPYRINGVWWTDGKIMRGQKAGGCYK